MANSKTNQAVKKLVGKALVEAGYNRSHTAQLIRFYILNLIESAKERCSKEATELLLIARGLGKTVKVLES